MLTFTIPLKTRQDQIQRDKPTEHKKKKSKLNFMTKQSKTQTSIKVNISFLKKWISKAIKRKRTLEVRTLSSTKNLVYWFLPPKQSKNFRLHWRRRIRFLIWFRIGIRRRWRIMSVNLLAYLLHHRLNRTFRMLRHAIVIHLIRFKFLISAKCLFPIESRGGRKIWGDHQASGSAG